MSCLPCQKKICLFFDAFPLLTHRQMSWNRSEFLRFSIHQAQVQTAPFATCAMIHIGGRENHLLHSIPTMMTIDSIVLRLFFPLPLVADCVACMLNEAYPLFFASYAYSYTFIRVHFPSCSNSYLLKGLIQLLKRGSSAAHHGRLASSRWATFFPPTTDNDGWPHVQNHSNFAYPLFSTISLRFWSMPTLFYFPYERSPRNPIESTAKA